MLERESTHLLSSISTLPCSPSESGRLVRENVDFAIVCIAICNHVAGLRRGDNGTRLILHTVVLPNEVLHHPEVAGAGGEAHPVDRACHRRPAGTAKRHVVDGDGHKESRPQLRGTHPRHAVASVPIPRRTDVDERGGSDNASGSAVETTPDVVDPKVPSRRDGTLDGIARRTLLGGRDTVSCGGECTRIAGTGGGACTTNKRMVNHGAEAKYNTRLENARARETVAHAQGPQE